MLGLTVGAWDLVTQALNLPKETPCVIVSIADHECVHQFLVQPVGDLLRVVKQDLLYLLLAYSRDVPRGLLRWTIPGQLFESAPHVDYLCVHRRQGLLIARLGLLNSLIDLPLAIVEFLATTHRFVEFLATTHRFLTTLPVVLFTKARGLDYCTWAVATVVPRLPTQSAAVWGHVSGRYTPSHSRPLRMY